MSDTHDRQVPPSESDSKGERFSFLGVAGESPVLGGEVLHRMLGLLAAVAWSRLIHDRLVDDRVAEAWRRVLRAPSTRASAELLAELIGGGKIRAADLLGLVPAESSRAEALTGELVASLRKVAARSGDGEEALREASEAEEILGGLLAANFEGDLVLADPASGPNTLADAARPGPRPVEGPAAFLVLRDGRRQPLHPFAIGRDEGGRPHLVAPLW